MYSAIGAKEWRYPKKIGIIIDNRISDETKNFILLAKQNQKVTVFGNKTNIPVKYTQINRLISPCKDFAIDYYTSKIIGPNSNEMDSFLIPDVIINDSIPNYKWKSYVKGIMEETNK